MTGAPEKADLGAEIRLITTQAEFDALMDDLSRRALLAVDTEAASFHRYKDRVYLLQVSSRDVTAVVDPLAVGNLAAFGAVLADPKTEIIFHDADYDLRLLAREFGFRATHLFDTRVAAQLLNEPGVGLAALLEKYLGISLDKQFQRADWSARPLSPGMLEYAAADTHYLPALRDVLRARLEEMGRLDWAEEEFSALERVEWQSGPDAEPAFLRLKGAKALRGRALAILRELYEWRDRAASKADRAPFRIMNNEPLLAMAKDPPTSLAALQLVKGVGRDIAERRGGEILAAITRGLEIPESEVPKIPRSPRRAEDPALDARLERLKVARNAEAVRLDLAPGVLCPNGTLEAIARRAPNTMGELREVAELRRWQVETVGPALLGALRSPTEVQ